MSDATTRRLLLAGGRLFDGSGAAPRRADVLVEDGRVAAVGEGIEAPGAERLDVAGATVLPGLIDAHVHVTLAGREPAASDPAAIALRAARNVRELLEAGVTTARDVGGIDGIAGRVRDAVAAGALPGAELLVAGQMICATGGHGSEVGLPGLACEASGPDAFRAAVRRQLALAPRAIKVTLNGGSDRMELTDAELEAAVDEAHRHGLPVAVHASCPPAVEAAVRLGVDTVEHGNGADAATLARMAERGVALTPTARMFAIGAEQDLSIFSGPRQAAIRAAFARRLETTRAVIAAAREAGVPIVAGTDMLPGFPVAALVDELRTLADFGLTRAEALVAATSAAAAALRAPDRGRVEPGLRADLLVVDGDPTQDLDALRRPRLVLQAGARVPLPAASAAG